MPCGSDIAIALHTPPHRAVSLALVGKALGATQGKLKDRLSRIMNALSTGSFNLPKGRISSSRNSSSVSKAVDSKMTTMTSTHARMTCEI